LDKGTLIEAVFNQPDNLVVPLPVGILMIGLVFAEVIEIELQQHIAKVRQRLIEAYEGDDGWKGYMNGMMGMNTFSDLIVKYKADKAMLLDLIKVS
jgi:hypothetical protein